MAGNSELWNKVGVNQQSNNSGHNHISQMSGSFPQDNFTFLERPLAQNGHPPPIPPRLSSTNTMPYNSSNYPVYSHNNGYSNMGYYPSYPFGGMANYSGFYNQFGGSGVMQHAEASTKQAFQSVETFVRAFGSISMMMESTLQAVTNSFRAIMAVIDHFSRMQIHMSKLYSAISLVRLLKWFLRKLNLFVRVLRFGRTKAMDEQLWKESANFALKTKGSSMEEMPGLLGNLPVLIFFAIVLGGPWLLWKLASSVNKSQGVQSEWKNGLGEHYKGVMEYDFAAQRDDELSITRGTRVYIAPKDLQPPIRGWALVSPGNGKVGFVPQSYIKVIGKRDGQVPAHSHGQNSTLKSKSSLTIGDQETKLDQNKEI